MADPTQFTFTAVSQSSQADAAVDALLRLTESAKDFLKYQQIYTEAAQANKTLSLKELEIREKDEKIKKLESAIEIFTHTGQKEVNRIKLEKVETEMEKNDLHSKLKKTLKEKEEIEEQAGKTKRLLDARVEESVQLQKEVFALRAREESLKTTLMKETKELDTARNELKKYAAYTANLVDLDLKKFSNGMDNIWECTHALVKKYYSHDILTESSEEHDQWTQHVCRLIHPSSGSVLIPATNSFAAKLARRAVMLNVFALVLVRYIFTATPLPLAQGGLDHILSELVGQDEKEEALCRAILLSTPSGAPSHDKELQQLVKSIMEVFATILPPKTRMELKSEVKTLMTKATDCWVKSRWSRRKLVATLDYESYPESWRDHPLPSHKHQQNTKNAEASDPEDEEEVAFVAFPAIIAVSSRETIYPGFLIRYSHVCEAEVEWRNEHKKRRFSRSGVPNGLPGLPSLRDAGPMV